MRNKKGFTLIELIVVIVIIGILAAIAIPRFMGAQDRAKRGACAADVDAFRQALGLYEIDYSDFPTAGYASSADLADALVMPPAAGGGAYMTLPAGDNWSAFTYTYVAAVPPATSSYLIQAIALDNGSHTCHGDPNKTWYP